METNERSFRKHPASGRELSEQLGRPALWPLPAQVHEYAAWLRVRVSIDYRVATDRYRYSVPCELVREPVACRLPAGYMEILRHAAGGAAHTEPGCGRVYDRVGTQAGVTPVRFTADAQASG